MISRAEAIRPATAAPIASSDRRCAVDVPRAAATALSVERKSAKRSRTAAKLACSSCLTIVCRVAAGLSVRFDHRHGVVVDVLVDRRDERRGSTPFARRCGRELLEVAQALGQRRPGARPRCEQVFLAREDETAKAGIEVEHEPLEPEGLGGDGLRVALALRRVVQRRDGEDEHAKGGGNDQREQGASDYERARATSDGGHSSARSASSRAIAASRSSSGRTAWRRSGGRPELRRRPNVTRR